MADEEDVKVAYEKARADLISALQKKRAIDRSLVGSHTPSWIHLWPDSPVPRLGKPGGQLVQF